MTISGERGDLFATKADVVVRMTFAGDVEDMASALPEAYRKAFVRQAKMNEFGGEAGQTLVLTGLEDAPFTHLMVAGTGSVEGFVLETARDAVGVGISMARRMGAKTVAMTLPGEGVDDVDVRAVAEAVVVAAQLANYAFDTFKKSNGGKKIKDVKIVLKNGRDLMRLRKGVERGLVVASGVCVARDLVNMPAANMTPEALAEAAERVAKEAGRSVKVKVLDREACAKLGMGAYLAVAQGSDNPPKFIHLSYKPERSTKKKVVLIGKGVTFDSGGLSIKTADGMMTMKCDMAGAAAVIGTFATLAALQPRVEVHGLIAATENMPSGKAIRPGDIVKSMSGKTIEILNTDAEGRLTLADALTYAGTLEPTTIVDLATLTGACMVALGEEIAGLMTNTPELGQKIMASSRVAGEKFWELPLEKRYRGLIESEIADVKNVAGSRYGGTLTAGLFVQEFVPNDVAWAHLDIAGPAFAEKPLSSYVGRGGSGFGVRTLVDWLSNM